MTRQIDRKLLQEIREPIIEALKPVAEKYGISIDAGGGQYAGEYGTLKLEFATISESGEVVTKEASAYREYAGKWGDLSEFDPDWLNKEFDYAGSMMKLTGFRTKARKNDIELVRLSDGKTLVAPHEHVLRRMVAKYGKFEKAAPAGTLTEVRAPGEAS